MRPLLVVDLDELLEQGLEPGDGGRAPGLCAQPVLEGLLETFDLAAGRGVVRSAVLLNDAAAT
jgi:hypothetical protein